MIQAHKGYFTGEVQFISDSSLLVKIPANKQVTVLWDDEPTETKTLAQMQNEALKQFRAGIKEITDEPIDNEFRAIINSGIIIDSGVEL